LFDIFQSGPQKIEINEANPNNFHIILSILRSTMKWDRPMAKEFDNFVLLTGGETGRRF